MVASHMNPEEAYKAAVDLGASKALGVHGRFTANLPLISPTSRSRNQWSRSDFCSGQRKISNNDPEFFQAARSWLPKIGETRTNRFKASMGTLEHPRVVRSLRQTRTRCSMRVIAFAALQLYDL